MLIDRFKSLLQDPPPEMVFEISEAGLAASRTDARAEVEFRPFKPGTLSVSPLKENVMDADEFTQAVRSLAGGPKGAAPQRKRRDVALILPDYSVRVSVLDFDVFPSDAKEQMSLVRFRLKRSVPFDVDSAAMSYWVRHAGEKKREVVAAIAPLEIVSRYEAPFRANGMSPGLVGVSSLAALELVPDKGLIAVAKISGGALSALVVEDGALKLARCVELAATGFDEVAAFLIPTFAFIEDNLGRRPERLVLCGFGPLAS
jgi:type IV pilus assembly protein PilM